MRFSSALQYSRSGARIPVDVITPFRCNDTIRHRYEEALRTGKKLAICLEGDAGTAKGQVLWRLQSQGYQTIALPFVNWLEREKVSVEQLRGAPDVLVRYSEKWQEELDELIIAALKPGLSSEGNGNKNWRPGLLFVARSPVASSRELKRRGLVSQRAPRTLAQAITVGLHADSIMIARRVAEKTFNDPLSNASKLHAYLRESHEKQQVVLERLPESLDSTSSKQCVANLLTYVGVRIPTFPGRKEQ